MALSIDSVTANGVDAAAIAAGNFSWSHTFGASNKGAIVAVIAYAHTNDEVTGVTINGNSFDAELTGSPLQSNVGADTNDSTLMHVFHWSSAISAGAQTVAVTTSGSSEHMAYCISYNADSTAVLNAVTSTSVAADDPSGTLALGGTTSLVFMIYQSGLGNPANITPLSGWTNQRDEDLGATSNGVFSYDTVASSDVTLWVTTSASEDFVAFAVAIAESGGAATSSTFSGVGMANPQIRLNLVR